MPKITIHPQLLLLLLFIFVVVPMILIATHYGNKINSPKDKVEFYSHHPTERIVTASYCDGVLVNLDTLYVIPHVQIYNNLGKWSTLGSIKFRLLSSYKEFTNTNRTNITILQEYRNTTKDCTWKSRFKVDTIVHSTKEIRIDTSK